MRSKRRYAYIFSEGLNISPTIGEHQFRAGDGRGASLALGDEWSALFSSSAAVPAFRTLVESARADYSGKIGIDVNKLEEADLLPGIAALADFLGVTARRRRSPLDYPHGIRHTQAGRLEMADERAKAGGPLATACSRDNPGRPVRSGDARRRRRGSEVWRGQRSHRHARSSSRD
jgi:hypothetical protein